MRLWGERVARRCKREGLGGGMQGCMALSLDPPEPGPEWNQETKMESGKAQRSQSLLELQWRGGEKKVGGEGRVGWGVKVG